MNGAHTADRRCLCDGLSEMTGRENPTGIQIPTGWSERKGLHVDSTIHYELQFEHACTHVHVYMYKGYTYRAEKPCTCNSFTFMYIVSDFIMHDRLLYLDEVLLASGVQTEVTKELTHVQSKVSRFLFFAP